MPSVNILNLVKKKILKIAIYLIQNLQHGVQIVGIEHCKTLIVEIDISKCLFAGFQHIITECGFAATSHTNHHLSHIAV